MLIADQCREPTQLTKSPAPIVIDDLSNPTEIGFLRKVASAPGPDGGGRDFRELLLQNLVERAPGILPTREIDRSFDNLRSVCTELRLRSASRIDNLLANDDGRLCIVECKLWRNPAAQREVVAQVLDYAAELSTMSYEELRDAVGRTKAGKSDDALADAVLGPDRSDEDYAEFVDGVSENLKFGKFLLLILGDGVRPTVERITGLLERRGGLGFILGLVEVAIYADPGEAKRYYVQPRVLAKTDIVGISPQAYPGTRAPMDARLRPDGGAALVRAGSISEEEFHAGLEKAAPEFARGVRDFVFRCAELGCEVEFLRQLNIYVPLPAGGQVKILKISKEGKVEAWGQNPLKESQLGVPVFQNYLQDIAKLLPGAEVGRYGQSAGSPPILLVNGRVSFPVGLLVAREQGWLDAIARIFRTFDMSGPT